MCVYVLYVHLMSGLANIPDIPGIGDIKRAIMGAIQEVVDKMLNEVVEYINDLYTRLLELTIKFIATIGMPPEEIFKTGPISLLLGGTYGLGLNILRLAVVVMVVVMLVSIALKRRTEIAGRTATSLLYFMLLGGLFYPVYGILDSFARAGSRAMLNAIAEVDQGSTAERIAVSSLPTDFLAALFTAGLGSVIMFLIVLEVMLMYALTIIVAVFYPLSVAMRPFFKFGMTQFKFMTAALFTVPLSMVFMSLALSLGVISIKVVQGIDSLQGDSFMKGLVGSMATVAGGLIALATPIMIFYAIYQRVGQMVTNGEMRVQNALDIGSMPPMTLSDAERSSSRNRAAMLSSFGAGAAGAATIVMTQQSGQRSRALTSAAIDRATLAAKASPDPKLKAVAWGVDLVRMRSRKDSS